MLRRLEDGAFEDLSQRFDPDGCGPPDAADIEAGIAALSLS